nr:hypothetical protein [Streptomyces sp. SID4985]
MESQTSPGQDQAGAARRTNSPAVPEIGSLVHDKARETVAVFRGVCCGQWWCLRPVTGGASWQADPADVQPASPEQRLNALTACANARSRGEYL